MNEVARYEYTDIGGMVKYYNVRYEPKDFRLATPTPGGGVSWGLKGKDIDRVVYRLDRIAETTHTIFFVEGEKDVHALEALGLVATCIAGGSNAWRGHAFEYAAQLTGHDIVILPDNDEPGRKLAAQVVESLTGRASRLRVVELPGLGHGGDVSDWISAGGTVDQLWALCDAVISLEPVQPSEPAIPTEIGANDLRQMHFAPLKWLASGILHEGMILFGGKSKRGKSWVALNLAMSVASGGKVFGQYEVPYPEQVLYCALEDGPRRMQRRMNLIDSEGDYARLKFAFEMPALSDGGIEYLRKHIVEGYRLIIIDVLAHVESAGKNGLRDYHEVYETFKPIQELRSQYPFALVMITHLRKSESEEVFDNLHGSVAYQGAQDALWVFERKSGDDRASLHIRGKDLEDKVAELHFDGHGIWSFVGEGEEHAATVAEEKIIAFLKEESQPQAIRDIMAALDMPPGQYAAMRQRLSRMASKQLILRTDRGKYLALSSAWEN